MGFTNPTLLLVSATDLSRFAQQLVAQDDQAPPSERIAGVPDRSYGPATDRGCDFTGTGFRCREGAREKMPTQARPPRRR